MVRSLFLPEDVSLLLRDVTSTIQAESREKREKRIKEGIKAYEMIPLEDAPTQEEILFYEKALTISADDTAFAIRNLAELIYKKKGKDVVLVSLIRGGIPAGILIKRYLEKKYNIKVEHYALTLIGTMGIDKKALEYILERVDANRIQFIDGWTGKGAVGRRLEQSLKRYPEVSLELAVLSDPANLVSLCGTHSDILIASACLNAPLAGLVSRAISMNDGFFGAVFFEELVKYDRTYHFINEIEKRLFVSHHEIKPCELDGSGLIEVEKIAREFGMSDIHFVKPGIGETIRAFIRKKPDLILVNKISNKYTELLIEIAKNNNILLKEYELNNYNCCALYKDNNSDVL